MAKESIGDRFSRGLRDYGTSLKYTPQLLSQRVFLTKTFEQMVKSAQVASKNPMKRVSVEQLQFNLVIRCLPSETD